MSKEEVFRIIRRNKWSRKQAIVLISDFLQFSKTEAMEIYDNEYSGGMLDE